MATGGAKLSVFIAVCALLIGCAGPKLDAWDFPTAQSARGAMPLEFSGRLAAIRHGAPRHTADVVYLEGGARWSVVVRITASAPVIPPFVPKRRLTLGIDRPTIFFGTNDLKVGSKVDRRLSVWRTDDGRLHAALR